ncbi:MAG: tRNA 5-methoxyuridine(34)/uridine 5-oxyacetic acid(34) synthase CmoB [Spirochaetes bacterium]|nr:tRNA 5-methoxyuridine(34)/uridine 5-oxyacetic acid(34) synthase CmoB [Spirochaetota bacterium]
MQDRLDEIAKTIGEIRFIPEGLSVEKGIVRLTGRHRDETSRAAADKAARELIPWRKGPFAFGGLELDAEWRSDKKWDRLAGDLPDLKGKIVADVGCNNGYYLFRIAEAGAARVVGFDPTLKYKLQYDLAMAHAPALPIEFRVEGWDALAHFPEQFDAIFLMGVNYHAPEPAEIFYACKRALKSGGLLICESVVVDSPAQLEIFPRGKYAGIGGVYAIPSVTALARQLEVAGFTEIRRQHLVKMTADEQRPSEFSPQKSFADAILPDGTSIEGYPPLCRAALFVTKP